MSNSPKEEAVFVKVEELLKKIKYGTITLVIQDGVVVQIESNEKLRLK